MDHPSSSCRPFTQWFIIAGSHATYCGAQQYHFGITGCGTRAGGFDAPLRHPVEQQEEEAPGAQHPEAHEGHPPTTQTVALQLLEGGSRKGDAVL